MTDQLSAYKVLLSLAQLSRSSAHQLPAQVDAASQWSGVGFSLLGFYFVVPIKELAEMLEIPAYTRLPGVHSWVKGVSNVRGRLLPLFDLAAFFSGFLTGQKKHQRLLVLDNQYTYAGLWVDQVLGMQYFPADSKINKTPEQLPSRLAEFIDGYYEFNDRQWMVFRAHQFSQDAQFLNVAIAG